MSGLHEACERGDAARVKALVGAAQRDAIALQNESGATALFVAARSGAVECVRVLLEDAGDVCGVNARDGHQRTALFMSLSGDCASAVASLLIAHPLVDVTLPDAFGVTPLHLACKALRVDLAELLLSRCSAPAFVNARTSRGATPLHWLTQQIAEARLESSTDAVALVRLLLANGANCDAADDNGVTPFALCDNLVALKTLFADSRQRRADECAGATNAADAVVTVAAVAAAVKARPVVGGKKLQIKLKS
jgi:ankyrin repeat protein